MSIHLFDTDFHNPLIISGPCSAETATQVMDTAILLKKTGKVHLLRAGVWKPRTKPGSFEGIGKAGFAWLTDAKKETGLPVAVEVGNVRHVEEALLNDIDVLWIGARTTVNPFLVQEIADALVGTSTPVLIKNPINPDLDLWIGALERFRNIGVPVGLVHRGFSTYSVSEYRNPPMWHLPLEVKRRFPEIKMICDPSHISGKRTMLKKIAQTSIDLDFDGLMIETHINPDDAWSDAKQQITPQELEFLLNELVWRKGNSEITENNSQLAKLREQINQIDEELLTLIGQRMKVADLIGIYKKENNITIYQAERWNEILYRGLSGSTMHGLSEHFIRNYFDAIHLESIEHQNRVMNEGNK